jgi:hypothetical protein
MNEYQSRLSPGLSALKKSSGPLRYSKINLKIIDIKQISEINQMLFLIGFLKILPTR